MQNPNSRSPSSDTSSEPSETDTLIPPGAQSSPQANDDIDQPVFIDAFKLNVKRCKAVLGLALPVLLSIEVVHLLLTLQYGEGHGWTNQQRKAVRGMQWTDGVGVVLTSIMILFHLTSLIWPIRIQPISLPTSSGAPIQNSRLHRALCVTLFLLLLCLLIIHALPGILYTIITHLSPPSLTTTSTIIYHLRTAALLLTMLSVGSMRRGPKLYSPPPRLGKGFGLSEEKDGEQLAGSSEVVIKITPADAEGGSSGQSSRLIERDGRGGTRDQGEDDDGMKMNAQEDSNVFDYANSSMLDFLFLSYSAGIARRSIAKPSLAQSDLPVLEAHTRNSGIRESVFSFESEHRQTPIFSSAKVSEWAIVKAMWYSRRKVVLITLLLETFKNIVSFVQVVALYEIIQYLGTERQEEDKSYAYLLCWALFAGQVVEVLMTAYCCVRENYMLHVPIKMTLASLLFSKILRTTDAKAMEAHNAADDKSENGKDNQARGRSQVMNLLTIDSGTVASMATHTWHFVNGIITLIIGTILLYRMLGVSAFVGIACVPLSTPLSYAVSKLIYRCDKEWARARDARTGALKEFLLGVKVIKLNAFEPYFMRKVRLLRENEVMWQRWRYTLGTTFNVLASELPRLAILITFAFDTKVMGRPLKPATAFVALRVFNRIKSGLEMFPSIIQAFLSAKVALGRLSRFLSQPELDKDRYETMSQQIICENATIGWPRADTPSAEASATPTFKLQGVDLKVPLGKLTLVCGPLGAGKTLLLRAFLGEAAIESGSLVAPRSQPDATPAYPDREARRWTTAEWLKDSVAYAPQQSLIRHGTVRDNVLFGQPFWRERYEKALRQAALLPDLEILADYDLTEIGENGVNLSGGQKARVNLARCLYSPAKTVFLDDILSAVDAHTAQYIYTECLRSSDSLFYDRTVVLVSHHVGLVLPAAEYVIALRDGRVEQACPASEAKIGALESAALAEPGSPLAGETAITTKSLTTKTSRVREEQQQWQRQNESSMMARNLYKAEHQAVGRVATSHYLLIFRSAGGVVYWLILAVLIGAFRLIDIFREYWMVIWSSDPRPEHLNNYLLVWTYIMLAIAVVGGSRWVWLYGIRNVGFYSAGSKKVHEDLLTSVFAAPLSFFESTPQGRLLNVFGQDVWRLDSQSADSFGRTAMGALFAASSLIIVCVQTPVMAVVILVSGVPLWWISEHLNKLRSDIRRLTASASSPLYSIYNETIDGVVMVRAFGQNQLMMRAMKVLNNRERVAVLADWTVQQWFRAIVLSITAIGGSAVGFALVRADVSPAWAGFILSFALSTSRSMFDLMQNYSELEQTFVSAERINHYITMDDREPVEGIVPEASWPSRGEVKVEGLCSRYASDLPDVLHDVSFRIEPSMRVGLVGATGSGKSTLALSLFRALEPHKGRITIDGVDISTIALPHLRQRLNMVAQDGMLCSGTLRETLDVTGLRDDHEIYEALRRVHLLSDNPTKEERDTNPFANLETYVAVEGANFSQGQRQLLCLARALLKQSKILVMDEATSSVDFEMDAKITATIKECFGGTTMLVIAHRLATIINYDRVIVLDKGQVVEYGAPNDLMEDEESAFYKLCMAQGEEEFAALLNLARA